MDIVSPIGHVIAYVIHSIDSTNLCITFPLIIFAMLPAALCCQKWKRRNGYIIMPDGSASQRGLVEHSIRLSLPTRGLSNEDQFMSPLHSMSVKSETQGASISSTQDSSKTGGGPITRGKTRKSENPQPQFNYRTRKSKQNQLKCENYARERLEMKNNNSNAKQTKISNNRTNSKHSLHEVDKTAIKANQKSKRSTDEPKFTRSPSCPSPRAERSSDRLLRKSNRSVNLVEPRPKSESTDPVSYQSKKKKGFSFFSFLQRRKFRSSAKKKLKEDKTKKKDEAKVVSEQSGTSLSVEKNTPKTTVKTNDVTAVNKENGINKTVPKDPVETKGVTVGSESEESSDLDDNPSITAETDADY